MKINDFRGDLTDTSAKKTSIASGQMKNGFKAVLSLSEHHYAKKNHMDENIFFLLLCLFVC